MSKPPFPRLSAYINSLPGGLSAYPEFRQKASVYRLFVKHLVEPEKLAEQLPNEVADLLTSPQLPSSWIPEVHATALYLALADQEGQSDAAVERHWLNFNRELLSSPIYRFMMKVISPQWMLKGVDKRWGTFHQGVTMDVSSLGDHEAEATLRYPPRIVPRVIALGYGAAFHAAVEGAGGKSVVIDLTEHDDTTANYRMRWG